MKNTEFDGTTRISVGVPYSPIPGTELAMSVGTTSTGTFHETLPVFQQGTSNGTGNFDNGARSVPDNTPDLIGLLRALRRRWPLALLGGLGLAATAAVVVFMLTPASKYTTSSMIFVSEQRPRDIFDVRESGVAYRTFQETQVILAKSRKVIDAALERPEVAGLAVISRQEEPAEWLTNQIDVFFPHGSEILSISMTAAIPPRELTTLVNAVTESYLRVIVDDEQLRRVARLDRLKKLFNDYQKELREKRTKFKEIATTVGSGNKQSTAVKQQMMVEHIGQARIELLRVQSDIRRSQAQLKVLMSRQEADIASGVETANTQAPGPSKEDPELAELASRFANLKRQLDQSNRVARKAADPATLALRRELARLSVEINNRRDVMLRPLDAGPANDDRPKDSPRLAESKEYLEILQEQERTLKDEIGALEVDMSSLNVKSMDFHWLEDEISLATETAKTVGTEVQSMTVEMQAPPRIRLIEKAPVPGLSDPLRRYKFSGLAAVGTFAGFLGLVSFWEFQKRKIATSEEVSDQLGLRIMGDLPKLERRGTSPRDENVESCLVESIDAIRTLLLNASRMKGLRTVMVSSAVQGEGKTMLSCQLATSLARSGRNTLLIDCDLRSPSVDRILDVAPLPGLCEVLRGDVSGDEVIQQTPIKFLSLIPAGQFDQAAIDMLSQDTLPALLANLRERFDFIIVDSSPILLVTDSMIVSQHVDAVIFSILREVSQLPQVQTAYQRLTALGVQILGAVISGVPMRNSRYYGSYPSKRQPGPTITNS